MSTGDNGDREGIGNMMQHEITDEMVEIAVRAYENKYAERTIINQYGTKEWMRAALEAVVDREGIGNMRNYIILTDTVEENKQHIINIDDIRLIFKSNNKGGVTIMFKGDSWCKTYIETVEYVMDAIGKYR